MITALAADVALSVNPTISPVTVPGTAVAAPPLLTKVLENEKSIVTALVGEVAQVSTPTANRLLANNPATFMFTPLLRELRFHGNAHAAEEASVPPARMSAAIPARTFEGMSAMIFLRRLWKIR
jgi:hypothetical protein